MAMNAIEVPGVNDYVKALPDNRREPYQVLLQGIADHMDPGFEMCMTYGMPGWVVPWDVYPSGYHCTPELPVPFASLGNQKGHIGFYHMGIYADEDALSWFQQEYEKTGWKLNMGASCIRLTSMKKIPYDLLYRLAGRIDLDTFVASYRTNDPRL